MQEYETIKCARALLAAKSTAPAEQTIAGYKKRAVRLAKQEMTEAALSIDCIMARANKTASASTWFGSRAALIYAFSDMIGALLAQQDKTQRAFKAMKLSESDTAWNSWKKLITDIQSLIEWLDRLQSEAGPDRLTGLVIMAPSLRATPVCFWAFLRYFIWKTLILLFNVRFLGK